MSFHDYLLSCGCVAIPDGVYTSYEKEGIVVLCIGLSPIINGLRPSVKVIYKSGLMYRLPVDEGQYEAAMNLKTERI